MQLFFAFLILCVTTVAAFKIVPQTTFRRSTTTILSTFQEDNEISSIQSGVKNGLNVALKSVTAAATTLLGTALTRAWAEDAAVAPKKVKKPKVLETDLGIKYIEVKKGSGPYPIAGDLVVINYSAFLSNGQMFDTTEVKGKKPLAFTLGKKQIIPGLESVIEYMQVGFLFYSQLIHLIDQSLSWLSYHTLTSLLLYISWIR